MALMQPTGSFPPSELPSPPSTTPLFPPPALFYWPPTHLPTRLPTDHPPTPLMYGFRKEPRRGNGGAVPPQGGRAYGRPAATSSSQRSHTATTPSLRADVSFVQLPGRVATTPTPSKEAPRTPGTSSTATASPPREQSTARSEVKETVYVCPKFAPRRDPGEALSFSYERGDLTMYINTETQDGKRDVENRQYKFAHTFGPTVKEPAVFEHLWRQAEGKLSMGHNATILCYGQTGSGKTYTVNNLLPQLTEAVFHLGSGRHDVRMHVSYLQIYLDKVYDLVGSATGKGLQLECKNRTLDSLPKNYVEVASPEQAMLLVKKGNKLRATNCHALNDRSSRSHSLYFLTMTYGTEASQVMNQSTLLVVDLAGSERVHKTKATGDVFEEGKAINKALTTLGRVMEGLARGDRSIPYRENILTMYLRETLTNSFFALICCCSSDGRDADETRCTLKFGSVAKQVTITRKANELIKARTVAKEKQRQFDTTLANIEADHVQEVSTLHHQIQENQKAGIRWQREAEQMKTKLVRERERHQMNEGKLADLTKELASKELEAETSLQDLAMIQEKYDELLEEIKTEQNARQKAESTAAELRSNLDTTTQRLEQTAKKAVILQSELANKSLEVSEAKQMSLTVQTQLDGKQKELQEVRHFLDIEAEGKAELLERESELAEEIQTLDVELDTAKQHLHAMQDERGVLAESLRKAEEYSNVLTAEKADINASMNELRRTKSKLAEECSSLRRDRENAESIAQKAMDDNKKIASLIRAKEEEAERLRREADRVCLKVQEEMKQARKLHKQLQLAEEKRAAAERNISLLDMEAMQTEQRLANLESNNRSKEADIAALETKLNEEREQHRADIDFLQKHIEDLERAHLEKALQEEQNRASLLEESERLLNTTHQAEQTLLAAEEERDGLQEECEELRNTVTLREEDLRKEKARSFKIQDHSTDLEVQLATEAEDKSRIEEKVQAMQGEHEAVLAQIQDELERVAHAKESLQEGCEEYAAEAEELRQQLMQSQQRYMVQLGHMSAVQAEQRRMNLKVQDYDAQLSRERDEGTRLRTELNAIQTQLHSATLTAAQKDDLEEELDSTRDQLIESQDAVNQMEDNLKRLRSEHDRTCHMVEEKNKECCDLSSECIQSVEELQAARLDVSQLRQSNRKILSDKKSLARDNDRMKRINARHRKENSESGLLSAIQVKSANMERHLNKLDLQNRRLKDTQRAEQLESRRRAAECKAKEAEVREINHRYQKEAQQRKTEKQKADMKISALEDRIRKMKTGIDRQATYIKGVADRVRDSEKERDVLRNVLDQKDTFDYVKRSSHNLREPDHHNASLRSKTASPRSRFSSSFRSLGHISRIPSQASIRSASDMSSLSAGPRQRSPPSRPVFSQPPQSMRPESMRTTSPHTPFLQMSIPARHPATEQMRPPVRPGSVSGGYGAPSLRRSASVAGSHASLGSSHSNFLRAQPRLHVSDRRSTTQHRVPSSLFQRREVRETSPPPQQYGKPVATRVIRTDSIIDMRAGLGPRSRGGSVYSMRSEDGARSVASSRMTTASSRFAPEVRPVSTASMTSMARSRTASPRSRSPSVGQYISPYKQSAFR